jgi:hypothetical protein
MLSPFRAIRKRVFGITTFLAISVILRFAQNDGGDGGRGNDGQEELYKKICAKSTQFAPSVRKDKNKKINKKVQHNAVNFRQDVMIDTFRLRVPIFFNIVVRKNYVSLAAGFIII